MKLLLALCILGFVCILLLDTHGIFFISSYVLYLQTDERTDDDVLFSEILCEIII